MLHHLKIISIILCLTIILLPVSPVFAHNMLIEPVEEGKVQVVFEGGTPSRHAEVVVYDKNDEVIKQGEVDDNGKFSYPPEDAKFIVAEDDFGHRAEHVVGEEPKKVLPRGVTIFLVLTGFVLIAGIFHYRVEKKQKQN